MNLMTQEEFRALYPQVSGSKFVPPTEKPGDGSRYGKSHKRGEMNQTEAEFALILEDRLRKGQIKAWTFELETLPLLKRMTWLPDFNVTHLDDSIELVDVKVEATVNTTTIAKMKIAKHLYPQHRITMEIKLKDDKGWKTREFTS